MSSPIKLLFVLASFALVNSLDVELSSVECDPDLPVTADIVLNCDGSSRCTFGEAAGINGTMYYNGVYNTGIVNNLAYATANISLFNLNFNLFEMKPIYLCDDYTMTANEGYGGYEYTCPGDGSYNYAVNYTLPSAGKQSQSWLGSGWQPHGVIQMFAEADSSMLIGECNLTLATYVTPASGQQYQTPPASLVSAVVLGTLLALGLLWFCCCCCTKNQEQKTDFRNRVIRPYRVQGEDSVMSFRRMTEADRMA